MNRSKSRVEISSALPGRQHVSAGMHTCSSQKKKLDHMHHKVHSGSEDARRHHYWCKQANNILLRYVQAAALSCLIETQDCLMHTVYTSTSQFMHLLTWLAFFFLRETYSVATQLSFPDGFRPVRLGYKSYFFNQRIVFFSHNKSANGTFSHGLSTKRTGHLFFCFNSKSRVLCRYMCFSLTSFFFLLCLS